jgi:hypothetical protein
MVVFPKLSIAVEIARDSLLFLPLKGRKVASQFLKSNARISSLQGVGWNSRARTV